MRRLVLVVLAGIGLLWSLNSCSSDSREQTKSQSEIRRDSDRFFDKMKEEERSHPAAP